MLRRWGGVRNIEKLRRNKGTGVNEDCDVMKRWEMRGVKEM